MALFRHFLPRAIEGDLSCPWCLWGAGCAVPHCWALVLDEFLAEAEVLVELRAQVLVPAALPAGVEVLVAPLVEEVEAVVEIRAPALVPAALPAEAEALVELLPAEAEAAEPGVPPDALQVRDSAERARVPGTPVGLHEALGLSALQAEAAPAVQLAAGFVPGFSALLPESRVLALVPALLEPARLAADLAGEFVRYHARFEEPDSAELGWTAPVSGSAASRDSPAQEPGAALSVEHRWQEALVSRLAVRRGSRAQGPRDALLDEHCSPQAAFRVLAWHSPRLDLVPVASAWR